MKKVASILLSFVMLITAVSGVTVEAYAASKPKATSISSVTAKSGAFTVKWKKVKSVSGYQVQYSTNKKFKKNNKTVKVSKASKTSKTISKLKAKKKYYVRVRTYKKGKKKTTYSSWSKSKSVTTKSKNATTKSKDLVPVSITSATVTSTSIKVYYNYVIGQSYEIRYSTSPDMSGAYSNKISNVTGSCAYYGLNENTTYYFQIRTYNDELTGSWSVAKIVDIKTPCDHNWIGDENTHCASCWDEPVTAKVPKEIPTYHCTCGAWFNATNCEGSPMKNLTMHIYNSGGPNDKHETVGHFTMEPIPGEYETITTGNIHHHMNTQMICTKCNATRPVSLSDDTEYEYTFD